MVKKQKQNYGSFIENGQKHLQCKRCYNYVKVDSDAVAVTCSHCVLKIDLIKFPDTAIKKQKISTGRPAGWHFMNEFVDKDGNVFHKGKEQPELKGTLKPTKVKPPKKRKKLTKDEKLFKRAKEYKKKLKIKRKLKK